MTSDQRISLIIIIQLWVVFLLAVSSHFELLIAILILLLIGLSWFLTSLSLSFHSFLFDPEKFGLLIFCKSVRFNSWLYFSNSIWLFFGLPFAFIQLNFSASPSQIFVSPIFVFCLCHFSFSQPHPSASLTFPDSAGRLYQNSNLSGP